MDNVSFNIIEKTFSCRNSNREELIFDYSPSIERLWDDINYNNFWVELCINPYLIREIKDIRQLKFNDDMIGYVFPIALIDTEQDISDYRNLNNYLFVAYRVLLERIPEIKNKFSFSENFEKNISVIVINKLYLPIDIEFYQLIHHLRYLGYSSFFSKNRIIESENYDKTLYQNKGKQIKIEVKKSSSYLLKDENIVSLLEVLQTINNSTHRFILLYQVIEYLMSIEYRKSIDEEINLYSKAKITHKDFIDKIKNLEKESSKIKRIFDRCNININNRNLFRTKCQELYALIDYDESSDNLYEVFYHFRNQMTHSYRKIHLHKKEMGEVIQAMEFIVFDILGTYRLTNP